MYQIYVQINISLCVGLLLQDMFKHVGSTFLLHVYANYSTTLTTMFQKLKFNFFLEIFKSHYRHNYVSKIKDIFFFGFF